MKRLTIYCEHASRDAEYTRGVLAMAVRHGDVTYDRVDSATLLAVLDDSLFDDVVNTLNAYGVRTKETA